MKLDREKLLYDIANYAYIAGHRLALEQGDTPLSHLLMDILAEGNIDRVNRVLDTEHALVCSLLAHSRNQAPHTKILLKHLIHEYLACQVLADWLSLTYPKYALEWAEKATAVSAEIAATLRNTPIVRRTAP